LRTALSSGAHDLERIDRLIHAIANLQHDALNEIVAMVDELLSKNRSAQGSH
jgi:hypothetical protein